MRCHIVSMGLLKVESSTIPLVDGAGEQQKPAGDETVNVQGHTGEELTVSHSGVSSQVLKEELVVIKQKPSLDVAYPSKGKLQRS